MLRRAEKGVGGGPGGPPDGGSGTITSSLWDPSVWLHTWAPRHLGRPSQDPPHQKGTQGPKDFPLPGDQGVPQGPPCAPQPPQGTQGCPRAPDVPPRAPPDSHGQAAGASRAGARLHAQAGDDPHVLGLVDDCGDVAGGSQLCPFKATPPRATPPVSPCHPPISTPMSPKMRPHTPRPSRATQGMGAESCVFPQCHPGGGSSPVCVPPITQGVSTALSPPQCHPEGGCSPVSRPPPSPRGRLQPCVSPPPSPSGWVQS